MVHTAHVTGLEDQWEPEENTLESLLERPNVPEQAKFNLQHQHCFILQ